MELVVENVQAAEMELKKVLICVFVLAETFYQASGYNTKKYSAWCIILLSVACVIMLIVVIAKKAAA